MDRTYDGILEVALTLPDEQRVQLVDALIATLAPEDQPEFDEALISELERRCDELDAGHATTVPWEEVRGRVQDRLSRHA